MATVVFQIGGDYPDLHIEDIPRAYLAYLLESIGQDMGNDAAEALLDQLEIDGYFNIAPLKEEPEWK